jgi:hypothetical protein
MDVPVWPKMTPEELLPLAFKRVSEFVSRFNVIVLVAELELPPILKEPALTTLLVKSTFNEAAEEKLVVSLIEFVGPPAGFHAVGSFQLKAVGVLVQVKVT